jgi:hypothetical protein
MASRRTAIAAVLAIVFVTSPAAQSPRARTTPWGDPDLQGFWTNGTTTPLERPPHFGTRALLTPEELEAKKKADAIRAQGETDEDRKQGVGAGPTFWYELGRTTARTSMISDPPDGRLPPLTPMAQRRLAAMEKEIADIVVGPPLWKNQGVWVRCISRGVPGGLIPVLYNNNYQIVQLPGYVVIHQEMIHETRIIPLDGRPHLPSSIRLWNGDSRGRWEGQTLVVETTNFHPEAEFFRGPHLMGEDARVTERFTRTSASELDYQFTVDAPSTFTRPFTGSAPMRTDDASPRIVEYGCHEGNLTMPLTIKGLVAAKVNAAAKK